MNTGPWTAAEDALAIKHLAENKTFREVAGLIKRERNAVISRAHRKNWDYPAKKKSGDVTAVVEEQKIPPPTAAAYIAFPKTEKLPTPEPTASGAVLLEYTRENQCKFIFGEGRDRLCCGAVTLAGHSWCALHARKVFGVISPALRQQIEKETPDSTAS